MQDQLLYDRSHFYKKQLLS